METTSQTEKASAARIAHTPGPWMTDDETVNHGPIIIQRDGSLEVAAIYGEGKDQRAANARLIAAAPDLLEALQALIRSSKIPNLAELPGARLNAIIAVRLATEGTTAIANAGGRQP